MGTVPGNFTAWIDTQPVGPHKLIVHGKIEVNSGGWSARLTKAAPQGINPAIIILNLALTPPTGNVTQAFTMIEARFEESPPAHPYTQATIQAGSDTLTIPVKPTA
jgi:hypothetical protein